MGEFEFDLVVLTADKNMKFAIQGLLNRPQSLGIRSVKASFFIHPESDPGCLHRADIFLRPFINRYKYALVVFDFEGCGKEKKDRTELEAEVAESLSRSGWENRATGIIIEPELENWVWSESPEVEAAIGWTGRLPTLRTWLGEKGFIEPNQIKPIRPKDAMEVALRHVRMPRSSAIYAQLADRVGLGRCTDQAFINLKTTLQRWFPVR